MRLDDEDGADFDPSFAPDDNLREGAIFLVAGVVGDDEDDDDDDDVIVFLFDESSWVSAGDEDESPDRGEMQRASIVGDDGEDVDGLDGRDRTAVALG